MQNILTWTHCVSVLKGRNETDIKSILLNPNMIALAIRACALCRRDPAAADPGFLCAGFSNVVTPTSMLVIGMVIGDVDLKWVFRQKRPYLICLIVWLLIPMTFAVALGLAGRMHSRALREYILMIVLIAMAAPVAAMITQLAQVYDQDVRYASVINVMSVIFCIITMPLTILLYEMII